MAFNVNDYLLPDSSNTYGMDERFVTHYKNTANYDDIDLKTFQVMQDAVNNHKYASQGYATSFITGDAKISLSEDLVNSMVFPGYEATPEGYEKLRQDLAFGSGTWFTPKAGAFESLSDEQKQHVLRNTKNANYETASGEQQNELFTNPRTKVGDAEKTITLPTESYGDLTVTSIPDMTYKSSDGFNQMYVDTDQGRFVFLTNDYLNKGFVEDSPFRETVQFQNYSRGLLNPETRSEILGSAVPVDLSDIEGSLSDYGVSAGNNVSLDKLANTQGILIPVEQAEKLDNAYSTLAGTTNKIKGFAMVNGKPTYIEDDSYNTKLQYSENGNGSFGYSGDTRNIVADTGVRYQKGGLFDNFTGISFIDNTLGGISDALAGVEDLGREGVEGVDAALQNPYVRAVVKTVASVSPDPLTKAIASGIDAYATLDSGDDLSAGQVVNLVTSAAGAYQDSTNLGFDEGDLGSTIEDPSAFDQAITTVTDETVQKVAGAGASIIDGADPLDVVVDVFSNEIVEGIADTADTTIGKNAGDAIRNNPDITNTIVDVAQGDDVSTAIANNLGDRVAEGIGAKTTNEIALVKAGLSTGAGLDQGLETGDALFEGAKTYYEEGGTIPGGDVDVEVDGFSLSDLGIDLGGFPDFVGDINARFPTIPAVALSLFEGGLSIPEIEGLGIDISGVEFPEVDLGVDTDLSLGDVDLGMDGVDLSLGDVDVDLPEVSVDIPEVELSDVDLGIEGPDLPEVDGPDIDIDFDLDRRKGMLLDLEEKSPIADLIEYAFAQGLDPLGQIRPVLPRLNNYLTNNQT